MLRQTLRIFVRSLIQKFPDYNVDEALKFLKETKFHKRLRDEITMIPIPKLKIKKDLCRTKNSVWNKKWIVEKQTHILEWAIDRVNYLFLIT